MSFLLANKENMANYRSKNRGAAGGKNSFWMFGYHPVSAALNNPGRIVNEFLAVKGAAAEFSRYNPRIVAREELEKVLPAGAIHQGLALNVIRSEYIIEDVLEDIEGKDVSTIVILDQVSDVHNVGAVLRSSAAFGVDAVIIPRDNAPGENGQIAKSACGALETVPLVQVTNISRTMEKLKGMGYWCVGMDVHTNEVINKFEFTPKTVFVFGSEGEGMRKLTRDNCDYLIKLPMTDNMESLNLSNAVAVTLYERFSRA